MTETARAPPVVVIVPPGRGGLVGVRELWQYRELLLFLTWRDLKVRYNRTMLGVGWAILQPLMTMVVFSIFFGGLGGIPSDGVPYPVFSFAALVPWTYFAFALTHSSNSVVAAANLLRKVYFPRLVIPISSVMSGIVDFFVAFVLLLGIMLYYGIVPTANVVWVPAFLLLALVSALGIGFWLSALNVKFRDVRYILPFLTQFWLFATPIAYPSSLVPEQWRLLYGLNPMAGVVEGFRWALLGIASPPGPMIYVSAVTATLLLVGGVLYFRRVERTFADIV